MQKLRDFFTLMLFLISFGFVWIMLRLGWLYYSVMWLITGNYYYKTQKDDIMMWP